jgi:hypothetical protein
MNDPSTSKSEKRKFQFRIQSLLGLTLAAAVLMALGIAFGGSRYFGVFWSVNSLIAVLPILAVVALNALWNWSNGLQVLFSFTLFFASLVMPAIKLASDVVFGIQALMFSFVGIILFGEWGPSGEQFWYPIACTLGGIANILFFVTLVRSLFSGLNARRACQLSTGSSFLSIFVIFALACSGELNAIYLGYGLWAASMLTLAIGTWRVVMESPTVKE